MTYLLSRLARRLLIVSLVMLLAAAAAAFAIYRMAPEQFPGLTGKLNAQVGLPSLSAPLAAIASGLVVAAIVVAVVVAAVVAGRLLGRYLRRPYPPAAWWPRRLAHAIGASRDRLAPRWFELTLGRDSLADPYEVAKMFDGLSGVLRPRARSSRRSLLGPDPLGLAFASNAGQRRTQLLVSAVPSRAHAIEDRIRATYRDVSLTACEPPALPDDLDVVRLKKRSRSLRALQTTKDYQHSVVESLLTAMHGETVDCFVQLVITPTSRRREKRAEKALKAQERQFIAQQGHDAADPGISSAVAQKTIKGAVEGVGRALLWFDLRIGVDADADAALRLGGVINEVRQDNELHPRIVRLRRRLVLSRMRLGILSPFPGLVTGALSAAELATIWHLPSIRLKASGLHRPASRSLPAPPTIYRDPDYQLGYDEYGPVGLKPDDRRYGWGIIGAAGGGKTSLMISDFANVARDRSRAIVLIDPKEDFARDALHLIPHDRVVHYIDLGKPYAGLNVLALRHLSPQVRADVLIAALRETAGEGSIQSRSDEFLRASITAVCVVEDSPTLFHVRRMLDPFDPGYREWVVRELDRYEEVDFLRDYWVREFPQMVETNARFVAEATNAPRNKLSRFLSVPELQQLITHPVQIDLERIIDRQEILVINGSKAAVGEDNAVLFGSLVLLQVQKTLHQIQRRDRDARRSLRLFVDELHNFLSPSFATMLSEGRSARLEVTAAFQYTEQIEDPRVKAGVKSLLQNVSITRLKEFEDARTYATLAMEVFADNIRGESDDQRRLTIDPLDIVNMPNWRPLHMWMVDATPQPAFTAHTFPVEPMIATDEAKATAAFHQEAQRRRGWHPHDHGEPITPPIVWTTESPVQLQRRTVHVDLDAHDGLERGAVRSVVVALKRAGSEWIGFQASPTDAARLRWQATVPSDPAVDGWLPDGRYAVQVLITDAFGDEHQWTPLTAAKGDRPPEPVAINLLTVLPFNGGRDDDERFGWWPDGRARES